MRGRLGRVDRQFTRYLLAGAWNTAFGYAAFVAVFRLLGRPTELPGLLAASAAANVLAITCSFLTYKLFVFRTQGHYLREYLRCYVVYGASALLGMALLAALVRGLHLNAYLAQAMAMGICIGVSFLGHRGYSFKR